MSGESAGEFQLIDRHFTALGATRNDVVLGIGDDAALLCAPPGHRLAVASASASAHAEPDALAIDCFERAARALETLGAAPAWLTLALTLDRVDEAWLTRFACALHQVCQQAGVSVVGGDTTAGPGAITIFLTGILPR